MTSTRIAIASALAAAPRSAGVSAPAGLGYAVCLEAACPGGQFPSEEERR